MARQRSPRKPRSLEQARRDRVSSLAQRAPERAAAPADGGRAYVAAEDVLALLNRIGECVRALPSFGRARTQTSAVRAKRTLSAISTCTPGGLPDGDPLRPVLARLDATRNKLIRQAGDHRGAGRAGKAPARSRAELIDDLAFVAALIAAEIDRLQHLPDERRYA